MDDDLVRLPVLGRILRRRWRLLTVLAVLGALVGAASSLVLSPGYVTSTSILLQGPREPDQILTETQIATSSVVLDRTAAALAWGVSGTDLARSVTAEAVDGNVIELGATAETPEKAQQLTDQAAAEYVTFSTQLAGNSGDAAAQLQTELRETLQQRVTATNERITELHNSIANQGTTVESVQISTELEALRSALRDAMTNLTEAGETSGQSKQVVMGPAPRPAAPASPTLLQLVAAGAALFVLLGIAGHFVAARADRRLRAESDIAAALGAPLLGDVDVPDIGETPAFRGPLGRLRELVLGRRPWNAEVRAGLDEHAQGVRDQRVLTRLRAATSTPSQVLLLVPDDDLPAHRVADRLAAAAATDPKARITLRVTAVAVHRPTVDDAGHLSGAVVVLTSGSRTAWELVGIAEACADSGHAVLGAVLAYRAEPVARERGSAPAKAGAAAASSDSAMAGSA
ncbi:Capsular polysaccharide biosynthesis protein [Amycolatopsis marina]|uniref:Capsular polysaccharide biosynthesis protein n=1 Tax=Amycolatopsis marina TaxID=490629 RepID=A0A1I0XCD1_9PSEU|nr:hypothetical protein [Amycolatopsis marina]SFA98000.1 Capsular polysaccharide biosynthesis protein [Amycolatopsis marina]